MTTSDTGPDPTGRHNGPPDGSHPPGWAYEMRPLLTAADREEAAALVQERGLALAARGLDAPASHADAFRNPHAEAVGLAEAGRASDVLVGCMLLHRPLPQGCDDGPAPGLAVSLAHTAPGRTDHSGWLLTSWLADYAGRAGICEVHAQVPGWSTSSTGSAARLLEHLQDLGWRIADTGHDPQGQRVTRIRLATAATPALAALIRCTIPLPPTVAQLTPQEGPTL